MASLPPMGQPIKPKFGGPKPGLGAKKPAQKRPRPRPQPPAEPNLDAFKQWQVSSGAPQPEAPALGGAMPDFSQPLPAEAGADPAWLARQARRGEGGGFPLPGGGLPRGGGLPFPQPAGAPSQRFIRPDLPPPPASPTMPPMGQPIKPKFGGGGGGTVWGKSATGGGLF
jgi:hypothetical protein